MGGYVCSSLLRAVQQQQGLGGQIRLQRNSCLLPLESQVYVSGEWLGAAVSPHGAKQHSATLALEGGHRNSITEVGGTSGGEMVQPPLLPCGADTGTGQGKGHNIDE